MSKKSSRDLYDLIATLSSSEKRYFTLSVTRLANGKGNKYAQLFSLLDAMPHFDEQEMIKGARKIGIQDLSGLKNYLYDLILRMLRDFKKGQTTTARLRSMLWHVEVLYFKGLYEQCRKMLSKARKLAENSEYFGALIQVLTWETRLVNHYAFGANVREANRQLHQATLDAISKLQNAAEFDYLANDMFVLELNFGSTRDSGHEEELRRIVSNPLLQDKARALSRTALVDFYDLFIRYCRMSGKVEQSYRFACKKLEVFEQFPDYAVNRPYQHAFAISHFLCECLEVLKFEEFEERLQSLRKLKSSHKEFAATIDECAYRAELGYCVKTGQVDRGLALLKTIVGWLKETPGKIEVSTEVDFYYLFSYLTLIREDYEQALFWNNKILDHPRLPALQDMECSARLVNLIIHYELGNTEFLENRIRATYRFLAGKQRLYRFETHVLRFIRHLPALRDKEDLQAALLDLRHIVLSMQNDTFERRALGHFDFTAWLDAKIHGRAFKTLYHENVKRSLQPAAHPARNSAA